MLYLLAKYTLLFLLTTLIGFILGRWWTRRFYEDVTENYMSLKEGQRKESSTLLKLWRRIDTLDQGFNRRMEQQFADINFSQVSSKSDVGSIKNHIAALDKRVADLPEAPQPDYSALYARFDAFENTLGTVIEEKVQELRKSGEKINFRPVNDHLDQIEYAIRGLKMPNIETTQLSDQMASLKTMVAGIPKHRAVDTPNFNKIESKLDRIQNTLSRARSTESVDVKPLFSRMKTLEEAIRAIRIPAPVIDLSSLQEEFTKLHEEVNKIGQHVDAVPSSTEAGLAPLHQHLNSMASTLQTLQSQPKQKEVDFEPVYRDVHELKAQFAALSKSDRADFRSLNTRLDRLDHSIKQVHALPSAPINFQPLEKDLADLKGHVSALEIPDSVDIQPLKNQIGTLEQAIKAIEIPTAESIKPDLSPLQKQVDTLIRLVNDKSEKEEYQLVKVHASLKTLEHGLSQLAGDESQDRMKIQPVVDEVKSLRGMIDQLSIPESVNLGPLQEDLHRIENSVTHAMNRAVDSVVASATESSKSSVALSEASSANLEDWNQRANELEQSIQLMRSHRERDTQAIQSNIDTLRSEVSHLSPTGIKHALGLQPLFEEIRHLRDQVNNLDIPQPTDINPVQERIRDLEKAIFSLHIPEPVMINLDPIHNDLSELKERLDNFEIPLPTDVAPLQESIEQLLLRVSKIQTRETFDSDALFKRIDQVEEAIYNVDFSDQIVLDPLHERIDDLKNAIYSIPFPENKPLDLAPLTSNLMDLKRQLDDIPELEAASFSFLNDRISALESSLRGFEREFMSEDHGILSLSEHITKIEENLSSLSHELTDDHSADEEAASASEGEGPELLKAPIKGRKDDLKKISGVGPKLERLLNRNGVYYFWQIASWNKKDIHFIDDRLDVFKGRISRDDWITQARMLKKSNVTTSAGLQ